MANVDPFHRPIPVRESVATADRLAEVVAERDRLRDMVAALEAEVARMPSFRAVTEVAAVQGMAPILLTMNVHLQPDPTYQAAVEFAARLGLTNVAPKHDSHDWVTGLWHGIDVTVFAQAEHEHCLCVQEN